MKWCFVGFMLVATAAADDDIKPPWERIRTGLDFYQAHSLPEWMWERFEASELKDEYIFSPHINPFYLRGDFDGDSTPDIAILAKQRKSDKVGIIVFFAEGAIYVIAGVKRVGDGNDDLRSVDAWHVHSRLEIQREAIYFGKPEPAYVAEGLVIEKLMAASVLLYWDGSIFQWKQRAD